jgi:transcriptional regulator with XRE-family HTH domain
MSDRIAEHRPLLSAVGGAIARRRHDLGQSQEVVASACRFDRAYLSAIERGVRNPTLVTLFLIARQLDCTLGDILKEAGY